VPRLCEFYPGVCLTTEEKAWKNLSQVKKNLSEYSIHIRKTYTHTHTHTHRHTHTDTHRHTQTHTHTHPHTHTHTHTDTHTHTHTDNMLFLMKLEK
jgi:hypothetical protein